MATPEPRFMRELHQIRARLSREWQTKAPKTILAALHAAGDRIRRRRLQPAGSH